MRIRILHIEDNPGDARLVELLLAESDLPGLEIVHKRTLSDGLDILEQDGDFAAVLLDLTLEDSKGFETLERVLERFPDLNVIVLTGLSDKRLGINCVKAGAQDFLIKGAFDADLLSKSLRYSIERNTVLKQLEEIQRVAQIGNWTYSEEGKEFTASDEIYRIFDFAPRKTFFTYEDIQNEDCPFHIFCQLHKEVILNGEIVKEIEINLQTEGVRRVFVEARTSSSFSGRFVIYGLMQNISYLNRKERFTIGILELKELMMLQTAFIQYWNFFTDYIKGTKGENINFNIKKHPKGLEWEVEITTEISANKIKNYLDEYLNYILDKSASIDDFITREKIFKKEIELLKLKHQLQLNHLEQQVIIYKKENSLLSEDKSFFKSIVRKMILDSRKSVEKPGIDSFYLKRCIAENKMQMVFDELDNVISDNKSLNEIVIFQGSYNLLQEEYRKNILNEETYMLRLNRMKNSLLDFIDNY